MADAGGRFSVISAAEVPPIRVGSAQDRGGLPRNKFSPPSPRRIPRRKFLFRQKNNLSDSASEAIGTTRTYSDSGGLNRSPPRNCSATQITISYARGQDYFSEIILLLLPAQYRHLPRVSVKRSRIFQVAPSV